MNGKKSTEGTGKVDKTKITKINKRCKYNIWSSDVRRRMHGSRCPAPDAWLQMPGAGCLAPDTRRRAPASRSQQHCGKKEKIKRTIRLKSAQEKRKVQYQSGRNTVHPLAEATIKKVEYYT